MELTKANRYSLGQLTQAYNQTRTDYLIPMSMSESELSKYVHQYDVDLDASWVATNDIRILGLGLLGIRQSNAWITRLGVMPECRCEGIGGQIVEKLCDSAVERGATKIWLEMIAGNSPALKLFTRKGFVRKKTLMVARHSPGFREQYVTEIRAAEVAPLENSLILRLLERRPGPINWRISSETFRKLPNLSGFSMELEDRSQGWICFNLACQRLDHIVLETIRGDAAVVGEALLSELNNRHPDKDAILENIDAMHPICDVYPQLGYQTAFKRVEMVKLLDDRRNA